ncbi:hypothetical protein LTR66_000564 [Elasticomyces elasticus]|nr:hypothetical protein LTR66_000564 [Elasticomyces elasticus]
MVVRTTVPEHGSSDLGKQRVAIIGSGVSGLAALWALRNTQHEVHLYEKSDRLGGHTNTVDFHHNGRTTPVDTGFIVLNSATYPNFLNFLKHTNVKAVPTEMTFGVSRDNGAFEWAGTSLSAVFAQYTNIVRPSFWRMIFDIVRFNLFALDLLANVEESENAPTGNANGSVKKSASRRKELSIGEYLEREGYSDAFKDDYLIPMTAAVWSTAPDKCALEFPAITLVRFMWNHHLLTTLAARPTWMTLEGGSKRYVDAVMKGVSADKVHVDTEVLRVQKGNGTASVVIKTPDGRFRS